MICLTACSGSRNDVVRPLRDTEPGPQIQRAKFNKIEKRGKIQKKGTESEEVILPVGITCLQAGYGNIVERAEKEGEKWFVVLTDGTRILWDDGLEKQFEERLNSPDLEDQLSTSYPKGQIAAPPEKNDDPGRCRVELFFKSVYGKTRERVSANLVVVPWLPKRIGKKLRFNKKNNAAKALERVSKELDDRLPKYAMQYISHPAGTFNWRYVAGTKRLSAHSFGIAVDINVDVSNYWRWEMNEHALVYRNRIPFQIVEVFEKHGFIWGGKWYHYDTMHFEYRPELLADACIR
jgi:hypothetical protein